MAAAERPHLHGSGHGADTAFRWLAIVAAALVLVILGMIALVMTSKAAPVFGEAGFSFFTSARWSPPDDKFGALSFIWGTIFTSVIAMCIAVPVSLALALFTTQIAPRWLKMPMVYLLDLLAVVPSVVFGLWGVLTLVPTLSEWTHGMVGRSFLIAGVILAIMITPIITSLAREVIETTPVNEKEAALALGATRWEMITGSILPHSKGGLVGAVMLGLGRAMGETIAAALVIGSSIGQVSPNPLAAGYSMPAVLANEFGEADDIHRSGLIALAVVLFAITILVNVLASWIVRRSSEPHRHSAALPAKGKPSPSSARSHGART
jgi:phosphate transport system permease protein